MTDAFVNPSVILRGFSEGLVGAAELALEIARIILEGNRQEAAASRPLRTQDMGDRWSIYGTDPGHPDLVSMTIQKCNAAILSINDELPCALPTAGTAERFAAALVQAQGGKEELDQQRPFSIIDKDGNWIITGSRNSNRSAAGPGCFRLNVQKRNAQVLDISTEWVLEILPEVRSLLESYR